MFWDIRKFVANTDFAPRVKVTVEGTFEFGLRCPRVLQTDWYFNESEAPCKARCNFEAADDNVTTIELLANIATTR